MINKAKKGIFIVFDGVDGAGKTTQVNLLAKVLEKAGETVTVSKEPTDGPWGSKIRATVTTSRMSVEEELEAFIEDRKEHIEKKIKPALDRGEIVILDRYFYSTIAYQGIRGIELESLEKKVREAALAPDVVFILDIDPRVAALRIVDRDGKPNEFERLDDQLEIRSIFKVMLEHDKLLTSINGNDSIESINKNILKQFINGVFKEFRCTKEYGCEDTYNCLFRINNNCDWWNKKAVIEGSTL